ncbi:hypothetical protein C0993_010479 [Termitomyces sp. T159_Od127]|nr:hypothetical protein C0993_010479 [Termitomyces sp. T159_Od127]
MASYFETDKLWSQLEVALDEALSMAYFDAKVDEVKEFVLWLDSVCNLDESCHHHEKHQREIVHKVYHLAKKPLTSSAHANTVAGGSGLTAQTSLAQLRLPPLTDEEKHLLWDNNGCFRCRCPLVSCHTNTCKKGFPDPATYKPVTQATVDPAKVASACASKPVPTVAAVMPAASATIAAVLSQYPDLYSKDDSKMDTKGGSEVENLPNLLNPVTPTPPPVRKFVPMHKKFKQTLLHHKEVAKELKIVCAFCLERMQCAGLFEAVTEVNVVAVVHQRIETLAAVEELERLDAKMKDEFCDVFEPIAWINDLP